MESEKTKKNLFVDKVESQRALRVLRSYAEVAIRATISAEKTKGI